MRLYLDTSAAVKLVRVERETRALRTWLGRRPDRTLVTSALTRVELPRAVAPFGPAATAQAAALAGSLEQVALTDALLDRAAALGPSVLRSLDAIHLAAALLVGPDLEAVITYDHRMIDAADLLGLPVAHPGVRPS